MKIEIYGFGNGCVYCDKAVDLLNDKGLEYTFKDIKTDMDLRNELQEVRGLDSLKGQTVPQVFINDVYIGGYTDLLYELSGS